MIRAAVVCLINDARTDHGLPRLHASPPLDHVAQRWTNLMVARGDVQDDPNLGRRALTAGFSWSALGESTGSGYATPRQIVSAWLASAPHCQVLLDPLYADVGSGVTRRAVPGFGPGGATWTEAFGLASGDQAPSANWGPSDGCPYG